MSTLKENCAWIIGMLFALSGVPSAEAVGEPDIVPAAIYAQTDLPANIHHFYVELVETRWQGTGSFDVYANICLVAFIDNCSPLYFDEVWAEVTSLPADGSSVHVELYFFPPGAGTYKINAFADAYDEITELHEYNNAMSEVLVIA